MSCCICFAGKKYKCPGCMRITCSLECSKKHKSQFTCSGKQSNTDFIPISDFTINNLTRDFNFLQEVHRDLDNVSRYAERFKERKANVTLANQAKKQNIKLKFMPLGLNRSQINQSHYIKTLNEIAWSVELQVFIGTEKFDFYIHEILQSYTIDQILSRLFDEKYPEYSRLRLKLYENMIQSPSDLLVFYRKEQEQNKFNKVPCQIIMNRRKSLFDILVGNVVIEFPTLIICKRNDSDLSRLQISAEDSSESSQEDSSSDESSSDDDDSDEEGEIQE